MPLVYPNHLSIQVLPKDIKDKIVEDLENYGNDLDEKFQKSFREIKDVTIKHMTDADRTDLLPQFVDYCEALDKTRGLDFRKSFPIFKNL